MYVVVYFVLQVALYFVSYHVSYPVRMHTPWPLAREEVLRMLYHDRKETLEQRMAQELAGAPLPEFPIDVRVGRLVGRYE